MKNPHTDSPSGEKRTVAPARRDALRRLLARSRFQESLSLNPNRAVRVSTIAGLLTAAVFVTSLVSYLSGSAVLLVWVVAVVAGLSAMVFSWWNLGAPGGVIIVFAARAAIGATAVMQGSHLHVTMHRALQRMAGTLVGSLLVWLILSAEPPFWAVVVAIVFFQFITEITIGFNYALGQITVTPMALLMTYLAIPHASAAPMAIERVFDTMLGAVLGIIFAVIFSTVDDRRHLARFHREQNVKRRSLK